MPSLSGKYDPKIGPIINIGVMAPGQIVPGQVRQAGQVTQFPVLIDTGARIPLYLAFKNLKPFVDEHLGDVHTTPLKYRTSRGNLAHGIRADIIPRICAACVSPTG